MHEASAGPTRIRCNACGGLNSEISRFCSRCGTDLAAAPDARRPSGSQRPQSRDRPYRRCPKCHADNPGAAKFCCNCASDLLNPAVDQKPAADATSEATPPTTSKTPPSASTSSQSSSGRRICPGCHALNPAIAAYCAECGVELPKDTAAPTFGRPAGFWIRSLAWVIDAALLVVISLLLAKRLGLPDPDFDRLPLERALLESIPGFVIDFTTGTLYAMLFVGAWGGTIGKLLLGLRVVRFSDGGRVPYGLALGRSLAQVVSLLPAALGYLWIAVTPSKRGWHDYLCDTRVVHAKPE